VRRAAPEGSGLPNDRRALDERDMVGETPAMATPLDPDVRVVIARIVHSKRSDEAGVEASEQRQSGDDLLQDAIEQAANGLLGTATPAAVTAAVERLHAEVRPLGSEEEVAKALSDYVKGT
jgi:hypothetical protein